MLVKQLLELANLGVTPLWAPAPALERTVTGVNTAEMANLASYLSPGEIVLTALVWWQPRHPETARAFVSAAQAAGTVALIAGEGMHGQVPAELVEACRHHELPLFSVPQHTTFRAITDRIYRWLWADLRESDAPVLPSTVKDELLEGITNAAPLDGLLATAAERLGLSDLALVSAADRVIASSGRHAAGGSRNTRVLVGPGPRSPLDGWWLCTSHAVTTRHRPLLDELAALLSTGPTRHRERLTEHATAATALLTALDAQHTAAIPGIVRDCDLPVDAELTPVVVRTAGASSTWALDATNELLAACAARFAACAAGPGESIGFTAAPLDEVVQRVREHLPTVQRLLDSGPAIPVPAVIAVGIGPSADSRDLAPALAGAHYAAGAAEQRPASTTRVCAVSEMTSLGALLAGLPAPASDAFRASTIGPVIRYDAAKDTQLLRTLRTFLDNGASWTRTAAAMHLHVNTVHYRIERVEALTGRRVSDPRDQIDLHVALMLHFRG
ncbi:MAG TPA: PucR family transcriptional regulator [Pseudonocardiaceae bacterium]|nr:PucR family transcriptional regulator [Pseudonocardiaceae bacterium]